MLYETRELQKAYAGRIAWQSFSENNFDDFSDVVWVKKKKKKDFIQPLVAFPISNISYWSLRSAVDWSWKALLYSSFHF